MNEWLQWITSAVLLPLAGGLMNALRKLDKHEVRIEALEEDLKETNRTGTPGLARLGREITILQTQVPDLARRVGRSEDVIDRAIKEILDELKTMGERLAEIAGRMDERGKP